MVFKGTMQTSISLNALYQNAQHTHTHTKMPKNNFNELKEDTLYYSTFMYLNFSTRKD